MVIIIDCMCLHGFIGSRRGALANVGPNNTRSSISDSLAGFSSGVGGYRGDGSDTQLLECYNHNYTYHSPTLTSSRGHPTLVGFAGFL